MIEIPHFLIEQFAECFRKQYEQELAQEYAQNFAEGHAEGAQRALRHVVVVTLETRFGVVPDERVAPVRKIADETRLKELHRLALTCADLDAFTAALVSGA